MSRSVSMERRDLLASAFVAIISSSVRVLKKAVMHLVVLAQTPTRGKNFLIILYTAVWRKSGRQESSLDAVCRVLAFKHIMFKAARKMCTVMLRFSGMMSRMVESTAMMHFSIRAITTFPPCLVNFCCEKL